MNNIEILKQERKEIIKDYSSKEIPNTIIDEIVSQTKNIQNVIVKEIIEETKDTKSFVLIPDKIRRTNHLDPFKAGQYVSLKTYINDSYVTRAYSLSSSPKDARNGFYRITIKRVDNGIVSNYLLDNVKVGDGLTISKPAGEFTYNKIRDEYNVIGIAGGCGITPLMALAKAINDGDIDCNLTVFYSVKTFNDIIFKKEIDSINKKSKKVKFVITLTREEKKGYLNGHINEEMIKPYLKNFNTVFMCGPKALYKTMNEILSKINIPKKSVHYENYKVEYIPEKIEEYELKILMKEKTEVIKCKSNETLLVSIEKAGIKAPSLCRVGTCGFCRSVLIDGKIRMIGASVPKVLADNDYIHPCVTYPESDIVIRLDI